MRATIRGAILAAALLWAGLLAAGASAAAADRVVGFYRGKTVEIVVGGVAGTSYDLWARLLARTMTKYMPGHPAFALKAMGGASHKKAAKYLFSAAPRDGTVIGTFSRSIPTLAMVNPDALPFDIRQFNWIGSTDMASRVCVVRTGHPVASAGDLFEHELIVGGGGAGSISSMTPLFLDKLLGMKFTVKDGYRGTAKIFEALDKGEVDGLCQTLHAIRAVRPGGIESGRLKVLFNLEEEDIPGLDAPDVYDLAKTEEQRDVLSFFNANIELGRPFAAPPEVPAERVLALRRAFDKALEDKALLKEIEKAGLDHAPSTGEELKERLDELLTVSPSVVEKTNDLIAAATAAGKEVD
jgi:tripartite-type tricarboxylate transporter receptor subunit TctC